MTKLVSKILLFLVAAMMILQIAAPITVHAADGETDENDFGVKYEFKDTDPIGTGNTLKRGGAYMDDKGKDGVWNRIFTEYKGIIVGITGIGTLTMVCLFIFNFMKLGQSAGNPQARSQALTGLLWTGIAAAGLGGVTLFVGFSTSLLKNSAK